MTRADSADSDSLSSQMRHLPVDRAVCPFCGSINPRASKSDSNGSISAPCPKCTMADTPATRQATKVRIGPWFVRQVRNPSAPGMRFETLMALVKRGQVTPQSVVRGPTTHQLWRFAANVKGLSREFGLCYSCGEEIEPNASLCSNCNRLQDPPPNPDVLLEGTRENAPMPAMEAVHREVKAKEIRLPEPPPKIVAEPVAPEPITPEPIAPVSDPSESALAAAAADPEIALQVTQNEDAANDEQDESEVEDQSHPHSLVMTPPRVEEKLEETREEIAPPAPAPIAKPQEPVQKVEPTQKPIDTREAFTPRKPPREERAFAPTSAPKSQLPARREPARTPRGDGLLTPQELAAAFQLQLAPSASRAPLARTNQEWRPPNRDQNALSKFKLRNLITAAVVMLVLGLVALLVVNDGYRSHFIAWSQNRFSGTKTWFAGLVDKPQNKPTIVRGGPSNVPSNVPANPQTIQKPTAPLTPVQPTPTPTPAVAPAPTPTPVPVPTSNPVQVTAPAPKPAPTVQVVTVMPPQPAPQLPKHVEIAVNPPANPTPPVVVPETKKVEPKPDSAPALSDDQAAEQARDLWWKALDAEQRNDYKGAVKLYEQIKALPASVHPGLLDTYLAEAKKQAR